MKGVRHFLRNFTATAVKEHLRSEIEATAGSPRLTAKEIELVRFIREGSLDWERSPPSAPAREEASRAIDGRARSDAR